MTSVAMSAVRNASRRHAPGRWVGAREIAIFAAGYLVYFGVRAFTEGSVGTAIANAAQVDRFERALGVDWEPALQATVLDHNLLVRVANWIYIFGHWPLLIVAGVLLFHYRRDHYYLLRNACLLSGAVGLVIFAVFPVAPPRLAHLGVVDTVTRYAGTYRTVLPPSFVNEYAAMPSFHAGWNVLLAIVVARATTGHAGRVFAVAMPVAMVLSILVTANHFVLDAIVGTAIVIGAVLVLDRRERRRARPTLDRHATGGRRSASERSHALRAVAVRGCAPRGQRPGALATRRGDRRPRGRG